ncbi:M20/M25/M40 family metallo-hydrolase [Candidatus Roizmanbacteria bacterium]|nr:M20/M25/M40 family metallo-hydrolase [Candidatus Roizmanbacteria bacterium]
MNPDDLITLTKDLVALNSISGSKNETGAFNENGVAEYIFSYATSHGLPTKYIEVPDGRRCVAVMLPGTSRQTIVIIAHHDTVGVEDYPSGTNPFEVRSDGTFLHGRGVADMKSGIAVALGLLVDLRNEKLKTSILFISSPDEENESAGMRTAVQYLGNLKKKYKFNYIGALNVDSLLEDETQEKTKLAILGGSVGKLLPCVYVEGRSAHVSAPYAGISADFIGSMLVSEIETNPRVGEKPSRNSVVPPPSLLKLSDFKTDYSVEIPLHFFAYFNYLVFETTPREVLQKLKIIAEKSLKKSIEINFSRYLTFQKSVHKPNEHRAWERNARVYTYEEVYETALKNDPYLDQTIHTSTDTYAHLDLREKSAHIVQLVSKIARLQTPFVVLYFAPPYYPSSYNANSPFIKTIKNVLQKYEGTSGFRFTYSGVSEGPEFRILVT